MDAYCIALVIQGPVKAVFATSRFAIWGLFAVTDHDGELCGFLAPSVGEYVLWNALPDSMVGTLHFKPELFFLHSGGLVSHLHTRLAQSVCDRSISLTSSSSGSLALSSRSMSASEIS